MKIAAKFLLLIFLTACSNYAHQFFSDAEEELFLGYEDEMMQVYELKLLQAHIMNKRIDCTIIGDLPTTTHERAQRMIVDCMERLVRRINSQPSLRKHLAHYPVTIKDIDLRIGLCELGILDIVHSAHYPYTDVVESISGTVYYIRSNPEYTNQSEYYRESYDECKAVLHYTR